PSNTFCGPSVFKSSGEARLDRPSGLGSGLAEEMRRDLVSWSIKRITDRAKRSYAARKTSFQEFARRTTTKFPTSHSEKRTVAEGNAGLAMTYSASRGLDRTTRGKDGKLERLLTIEKLGLPHPDWDFVAFSEEHDDPLILALK